jgi:hypothetical protein
MRTRQITQYVTKGKYVTESVPIQVFQSNYYPDGSGRSSVSYESRQKFITYTEPETKEELYYEEVPYQDVETYTEKVPYTVRKKVTKTISIPYTVYERKTEKVIVGYKDIIVEEFKTVSYKQKYICSCKTCSCSICKPEENICGCAGKFLFPQDHI